MKILTRLNHIKQLLDTSSLETILDEINELVYAQNYPFEAFDQFIPATSVNDVLYDYLGEGTYGWKSVQPLLSEINDLDANWFQFENGRLTNLRDDLDAHELFKKVVEFMKVELEFEFNNATYDVVSLLGKLFDFYGEQGLRTEMLTLDDFMSDLNDVSFKGFMPLYHQFQTLIVPVQVDETITLTPELKDCLATATESMESLKDYLEYLEG